MMQIFPPFTSSRCLCSVVSDFLRPYGLVARQASLSMESSRQEYLSGLPCPSPGESSQSRDHTLVFCIDRQILYQCTTWEAPGLQYIFTNQGSMGQLSTFHTL